MRRGEDRWRERRGGFGRNNFAAFERRAGAIDSERNAWEV